MDFYDSKEAHYSQLVNTLKCRLKADETLRVAFLSLRSSENEEDKELYRSILNARRAADSAFRETPPVQLILRDPKRTGNRFSIDDGRLAVGPCGNSDAADLTIKSIKGELSVPVLTWQQGATPLSDRVEDISVEPRGTPWLAHGKDTFLRDPWPAMCRPQHIDTCTRAVTRPAACIYVHG